MMRQRLTVGSQMMLDNAHSLQERIDRVARVGRIWKHIFIGRDNTWSLGGCFS